MIGTWPFPMASGMSTAQGRTSKKPKVYPEAYLMGHRMRLGELCQQQGGDRNQEDTSSQVNDDYGKQNAHFLHCTLL